jgi:hypothetical protein
LPPKRINGVRGGNASMQARERQALSRTVIIVLVVVVLVAAGGGVYFLGSVGPGPHSSSGVPAQVGVDLQIIEDDPVFQIQHFYPGNFTVTLGQNVSLAVRNGDDEPRTFVLKDFNVNMTIAPGTTGRDTFHAGKAGTFVFFSPPSVPSPVSQGRPGKYIQGNIIVTQ